MRSPSCANCPRDRSGSPPAGMPLRRCCGVNTRAFRASSQDRWSARAAAATMGSPGYRCLRRVSSTPVTNANGGAGGPHASGATSPSSKLRLPSLKAQTSPNEPGDKALEARIRELVALLARKSTTKPTAKHTDQEFEQRVRAECEKRNHPAALSGNPCSLVAVNKARKGVMTRNVYRKILGCLHPDNGASEKMLNEV